MVKKQLEHATKINIFYYIFYAFFQPRRLTRELQPVSLNQRFILMLKLAIPMFLITYPPTFIVRIFFYLFGLSVYTTVASLLLQLAFGIVVGIVVGIAVSIVVGIAGGIAGGMVVGMAVAIAGGISLSVPSIVVGMTVGIVVGMATGILGSIAVSIAASIARGLVGSISFGIVVGTAVGILATVMRGIELGIVGNIAVGIAGGIVGGILVGIVVGMEGINRGGIVIGINRGIAIGIIVGIVLGILGGIVLGILGGIVLGILGGILVGILGSIGVFFGFYRVPFYFITGSSALRAYFASRERPSATLGILLRSSLHWDELIYLPFPFLKHMLLLAYDADPRETLAEVAFIIAERPQQLHVTRQAILEIVMRYLETSKELPQISRVSQRLKEILPPETRLSDPDWTKIFSKLSDASLEAMSCLQPLGRQARLRALGGMIEELEKIHPNVAFRDQQLNRRLKLVINTWLDAADGERKRLENEAPDMDIGHIDNPYKPGQVLELQDSLYVGRRDLAQQLEYVLSKGNRRPSLLLQGERRMGKTSTLRQLPYLLGARYIPVVYNLQDPGVYASTTTLLGKLAVEIHDQLLNRDIKVEDLPFARLQELRNINAPMNYAIFNRWIEKVEDVLEKENRSLLLAFDEFEKLDEAGEREYLDITLFLDWCRHIIQYHSRIILLFSGVHAFSDMGTKTGLNWSSYFVNVQTLKVSFLTRDEAHRLVVHPQPNYKGEEIFGEDIEQILLQTNCHPFLLQALCSQLVDNLNIEKGKRVGSSHVTIAIEQMFVAWDSYFDDLWKHCDEIQRACLSALETHSSLSLNDILHHSRLDEQSIQKALHTLVRRDLVVCDDETAYRIAIPIFNIWVRHNKDRNLKM